MFSCIFFLIRTSFYVLLFNVPLCILFHYAFRRLKPQSVNRRAYLFVSLSLTNSRYFKRQMAEKRYSFFFFSKQNLTFETQFMAARMTLHRYFFYRSLTPTFPFYKFHKASRGRTQTRFTHHREVQFLARTIGV